MSLPLGLIEIKERAAITSKRESVRASESIIAPYCSIEVNLLNSYTVKLSDQ